jgi:hypothetical protein
MVTQKKYPQPDKHPFGALFSVPLEGNKLHAVKTSKAGNSKLMTAGKPPSRGDSFQPPLEGGKLHEAETPN